MKKSVNKTAASAMLSAMVAMHVEAGGMIQEVEPQRAPSTKNFGFDALNKARSSGAGRGGLIHNAGLPRVVR